MTNVIFSFDTEDFTSPYAANGILDAAELLRSEGIRGCFCMTGLLARQLSAWGRDDILRALRFHETDFHTYGHTLHPTIAEYTDVPDFDVARAEVFARESAGIAYVKAATGADRIYAAVPPGEDKSYAAMYAYADMGIPCYADTYADTADGRGVFFCNSLHLAYFKSLESLAHEHYAYDKSFYDKLATRKNAVIYNHPNRLRYDDFWDIVNYDGENKYPFGQWKEAKRTDEKSRLALLDEIRFLVGALKKDGRFTFKTYSEIASERFAGTRVLRPCDMPCIYDALSKDFYPLDEPMSLSVSDVFSAAVRFLRGDSLFSAGRVYGFLEEPRGIDSSVSLSADDVRGAAAKIDLETFLPPYIDAGGVRTGPADFLFAMLMTLRGDKKIRLDPRPQNIRLDEFPSIKNPPILSWRRHVPSFTGDFLVKRLPLQAWTIRF